MTRQNDAAKHDEHATEELRVPKISPRQLTANFAKSAGDEALDKATRELAARMCVASKWLELVAARQALVARKLAARLAKLEKGHAELVDAINAALTAASKQDTTTTTLVAKVDREETATASQPKETTPETAAEGVADDDHERALSLAEQMRLDAEAEATRIEAQALGDAAPQASAKKVPAAPKAVRKPVGGAR